jgi:SPP1 gp7 family putative phage head morphogenesis protein
MPTSAIHARRTARETKQLERAVSRAAVRVSGRVRARYIESLRSGYPFLVRPYIVQQFRGIMVNACLASHLLGYKRLFLIKKQNPGLTKKLLEQEQLVLSELSDILSVLVKRTFLDIDGLQKQYDTRALQVLNDVSKDLQENLDETFRGLIAEGATVAESIRKLGDKFDELGVSPKKPYQIETIFRTQTQLAFSAGRWQAEQHPDIQEILWGYKYVTTGDDRVRDEHALLDGVTLPKDDPFWRRFYPPNGWNCRCQAIPIFEERKIVAPPTVDDEGEPIKPDKDFNFNPGEVFSGR